MDRSASAPGGSTRAAPPGSSTAGVPTRSATTSAEPPRASSSSSSDRPGGASQPKPPSSLPWASSERRSEWSPRGGGFSRRSSLGPTRPAAGAGNLADRPAPAEARYWGTGSPGALVGYLALRILSLAAVGVGVAYIHWRSLMVIQLLSEGLALGYVANPPAVPIIGRWGRNTLVILAFLTEILLFLSTTVVTAIDLGRPPKIRLPPSKAPDPSTAPAVSFFVCCCQQPLIIIQDTVRAALAQNYPSDRFLVFVIDDAKDDSLKAWVENEAAEGGGRLKYVRQPAAPEWASGTPPPEARLANINWALRLAGGDFVAVVSAEFIPSPDFLSSLLPHLASKDVALVWCALGFYNLPRGDPLNGSQQDYYDLQLPYRDARGVAPCEGSGFIFRRQTLLDRGGLPGGTLETQQLTLGLHSDGLKTVYINERLQAGLGPWTLEGRVSEAQRRAVGAVASLGRTCSPLCQPGPHLSLYARLAYWGTGMWYILQLLVLPILLLPLLALALDVEIVLAYPAFVNRVFFTMLALYALARFLTVASQWLGICGAAPAYLRSEQAWFWMAPFYWLVLLSFLNPCARPTYPPPTSNGKRRPRRLMTFSVLVLVHGVYCVAGIAAVVWRLATLQPSDCGQLVRVGFYSSIILWTVQAMSIPILFLLFSSHHAREEQRDEYMVFDNGQTPRIPTEHLYPQEAWWIWLLAIIPTLQGILLAAIALAAVTGFRPSFCTTSLFSL